jgi:hypothetical protein
MDERGAPDWDTSSLVGPSAGLFFAHNLAYVAGEESRTFEFSPREAVLEFLLPEFLAEPAEVFRVDADGVHAVDFQVRDRGLRVVDRLRVVAVYAVAAKQGLRDKLQARHTELLRREAAIGFDPAGSSGDLEQLRRLLGEDADR